MPVGVHHLPAGRYASSARFHRRLCRGRAAPEREDDALKGAADTAASATPQTPAKEPTISQSSGPRSYPLEAVEPAANRPQDSQAVLGGAVAVLMLGALASSLKLTFGSAGEGTQSLPTASQRSDGSPEDSRSSLSGLNGEGTPGSQQAWWTANNVFLVTEAPHPQDPASASPVLIRTAHGEVLAVFETEASAARLAEKLSSWGALGTGAVEAPQAPAGHFRVAALQPRSLNIQNVPPTVLIRDDQITTSSLASPEAWQAVVTAEAPEQLSAWQEYVDVCQAPVIQADAVDVAPVNEQPPTQAKSPSLPDTQGNHRKGQAATPDTAAARSAPESVPKPAAEPDSMWRQQSPRDAPDPPTAAEPVAAQAMRTQPDSAHAGSTSTVASREAPAGPHTDAGRTAPEGDMQLEDMEPAVYASVEEMEEAEERAQGSGRVEEPLRLLSKDETDASLVHRNYAALPVVFAPMLFRAADANGPSWGGEDGSDTERMLFTVDTTIDEGDPDIVALVFEDPVDASALLSMLAHVRGFRDPDAVTRRVVPMPAGAAQDVASGQGASVLCMANGFQQKAEVRAGKEIDGLLSKIAGARWASLVDAQTVA